MPNVPSASMILSVKGHGGHRLKDALVLVVPYILLDQKQHTTNEAINETIV